MFVRKVYGVCKARGVMPIIDPLSEDLRIEDDGSGPRIVKWNAEKLGPQPTDDEIDAAVPYAPPTICETSAILAAMTPREHRGMARLADVDDGMLKFWNMLRSGRILSDALEAGMTTAVQLGVPSVWATLEDAQARVFELMGEIDG